MFLKATDRRSPVGTDDQTDGLWWGRLAETDQTREAMCCPWRNKVSRDLMRHPHCCMILGSSASSLSISLDNHHRSPSPSHLSSPRWRTSTKSARQSSWSQWLRGETDDFLWTFSCDWCGFGTLKYPFTERQVTRVLFYRRNNVPIQGVMHSDAPARLNCSWF